MKYNTINDIENYRSIIRSNEDRVQAIARRAAALARQAKFMSLIELENASSEIAKLRKEKAELDKRTREAKLAIAKFYAPASIA